MSGTKVCHRLALAWFALCLQEAAPYPAWVGGRMAGETSSVLQKPGRRQLSLDRCFLPRHNFFLSSHWNQRLGDFKSQVRFLSSNLKCTVITGVYHKINLHLLRIIFGKLEHRLCHDLGDLFPLEGQASCADGGEGDWPARLCGCRLQTFWYCIWKNLQRESKWRRRQGEKNWKEKFKLLYTATLYLMRSGIELIDAQRVIHLCTMQVVGSCGDDTSISNAGAFKFFFHLRASFLQYGPWDLTTLPTVFVCCVNNHIRLRQLKK